MKSVFVAGKSSTGGALVDNRERVKHQYSKVHANMSLLLNINRECPDRVAVVPRIFQVGGLV